MILEQARPGFGRAPVAAALVLLVAVLVPAQEKARARDLGVPFDGKPGPYNAITDVPGVEVGHVTLIKGKGKLVVGQGPVRTGVTAVMPRGRGSNDPVFAGWYSLNGNGEMTGTTWVKESGFLEGPVMITNTHSVGVVRDAVVGWSVKQAKPLQPWSLPVVAETYDGWLNDINGFHVKTEHALAAIDSARSGSVAEGNVGGGTGMICYSFKGGIGTASRRVSSRGQEWNVGVLVQANFGGRRSLVVAGVPMGREIQRSRRRGGGGRGSIIVVVATDAPLLPHQLERFVRRVPLGLARTGATSSNYSGDIFIAFSTANAEAWHATGSAKIEMLSNDRIDPLFAAVVQATEESVVNALIAAETMVGRDDHRVEALPHDRVRELLKKYGRAK
ncbi:MAG: P1 family peptidase [Planctomycetota bacterium]|nr:P1 family peptidase [Planctomycetota bacterium]